MKLIQYLLALLLWLMLWYGVVAQPRRVVSLVPSASEAIYEMQGQNQLVGCTNYCTRAVADGKAVVATAIDVNMERVLALRPDLVIASNLVKPAVVEKLRKLGIAVDFYPFPRSYAEIESQFLQLANSLGLVALAQVQLAQQKQRVQALLAQYPRTKPWRVFVEIGSNPLFTVVPNTFMDDYLQLIGLKNIASDLKTGTIGRETVVLRNPEIIYIVLMGLSAETERKDWARFPTLSAVKHDRLFFLDPTLASTPTPANFVSTVEAILKTLPQP